MKFAKYAFTISGTWGILVCIPPLLSEPKAGIGSVALTHPEYYYGFFGVVFAWQILFFVIARDPIRYRTAMIPAVLEKAAFVISAPVLFLQGRVGSVILYFAFADFVMGILFLVSFLKTPKRQFTHEI